MENKILIILGAGRSGTSFTASWLQKCGLQIGEKFIKPSFINKLGFFEDKEIMLFQDEVLKSIQKKPLKIKITDIVSVTDEDKKKAKDLVTQRNQKYQQWGWKDPDSCLLVNPLWSKIIPNVKTLVVYRSYELVVHSHLKIQREINKKNGVRKLSGILHRIKYLYKPTLAKEVNSLLESWVRYNQEIINFLEHKKEEDFCVVDLDTILCNPIKVFEVLTKKLTFSLKYFDIKEIYDSDMLTLEAGSNYACDKNLKILSDTLILKLEHLRDKSLNFEGL